MGQKLSRKFFIACSVLAISTVALFADRLTGGEFVTLAIAVIGIYGYHNVEAYKAGER
jgi:hypothetical protein